MNSKLAIFFLALTVASTLARGFELFSEKPSWARAAGTVSYGKFRGKRRLLTNADVHSPPDMDDMGGYGMDGVRDGMDGMRGLRWSRCVCCTQGVQLAFRGHEAFRAPRSREGDAALSLPDPGNPFVCENSC